MTGICLIPMNDLSKDNRCTTPGLVFDVAIHIGCGCILDSIRKAKRVPPRDASFEHVQNGGADEQVSGVGAVTRQLTSSRTASPSFQAWCLLRISIPGGLIGTNRIRQRGPASLNPPTKANCSSLPVSYISRAPLHSVARRKSECSFRPSPYFFDSFAGSGETTNHSFVQHHTTTSVVREIKVIKTPRCLVFNNYHQQC